MKIPKRYRGAAAALVAVCLGAALCAGGCSAAAGVGATVKKTGSRECTPVADRNVVFHSQRLANDVEIVAIRGAMVSDELKAQLTLRISPRAKDQDMLPLLYRFSWLDAEGKEIAAGTGAWTPLMIFGRDTQTIEGVAPDPRARDFRLIIHEADDSHC